MVLRDRQATPLLGPEEHDRAEMLNCQTTQWVMVHTYVRTYTCRRSVSHSWLPRRPQGYFLFLFLNLIIPTDKTP